MVRVIQADADNLADPPDTGTDTGLALDQRQLLVIQEANVLKRIRQQRRSGKIGDVLRQVPQATRGVEHPRLLAPRRPISQKLHARLTPALADVTCFHVWAAQRLLANRLSA